MTDRIADLTCGLYDFVIATETLLLRQGAHLRGTVTGLHERARRLAEDFHAARAASTEKALVASASENLRAIAHELESRHPREDRLRALWDALGRDYEALLVQMRAGRRLPRGRRLGHIKPKNHARNAFHIANGLFGVLCYELLLDRSGAIVFSGALLFVFVLLDVVRRVSAPFNEHLIGTVFARIVRHKETHAVPSATWYTAALFLGVILLPQHAIEMGVIAMALGDPAAALVGKRWGHLKLNRDKSLAGTIAFFVASFLSLIVFQLVFLTGSSIIGALLPAVAVAMAGAVAELVSDPLDDNFTIPLVAGLVAMSVI